ncbi:signal peptidase I [Streptomyces yaizuensis]|uniref:Signal peptidase I n=1 Tax=Streptomyces yaizuensis TaxID=2989713 RepID=A0ABQ5P8U7_9ACTN|nr:signal peptidase I [Streptomyces sp. YSPA8]GLF99003.1 signal peptidase I [Streptomyces sp. YSPA8]
MGSDGTKGGHGRLGRVLSGLAVAVGCLLFLGGFGWGALVYQPYTVPTDSMAPTVRPGDRVLAERIDGDAARRGDIVVFEDPGWGGGPMLKRVVGIGGDTVACCGEDGRLTVGGRAVDEPYLSASAAGGSPDAFTAKVPEGHLFLLGDERLGSLDSRAHLADVGRGSVPRSTVKGRLDAFAWPLRGGMIERPEGFAALPGGVSQPGPIRLITLSIAAGAVLIVAGAAHGPLTRRLSGGERGTRGTRGGRAVSGVGRR